MMKKNKPSPCPLPLKGRGNSRAGIPSPAKRERGRGEGVFALFLAMTICFSGCASFSEGTITYDADGTPHWEKLKSSGISRDAFRNPLTGSLEPQSDTDTFYSESPRVTWWGSFAPLAFLTPPVFSARWIDPSGNIFWEEDFAPNNTDFQLYKISLPIATSPAKNYPGWWQVEIYLKEKLIDRKKFQIIAEPPQRGVPITR